MAQDLVFVVQRHRATARHYDFRLELDGALVSWAVPKGPTLDPGVRRLAMRVPDHPMEYLHFEGVIPEGDYGGGDVIVWDTGVWVPVGTDDPAQALRDGELHMDLHGERLHGRFVLVRTGHERDRERWMLLHKHDEHAVEGWDAEDHPRSVLSGRTNEEVKADPDYLWRSDAPAAEAQVGLKPTPPDPPTDDQLAALDALGSSSGWEVFGRTLKVTNLDKVLFPGREGEEPLTKRDLIRYAAQIAPVSLPYLAGRALNLHRYPDGAQRRASGTRRCPTTRPTGCHGETTRTPTPARLAPTSSSTNRRPWCGRRTSGRWSGTRGPRRRRRRTGPPTSCSTSTRASGPAGKRRSCWPGCTAAPSRRWSCGPTRR